MSLIVSLLIPLLALEAGLPLLVERPHTTILNLPAAG
jgi:hypothetical protein